MPNIQLALQLARRLAGGRVLQALAVKRHRDLLGLDDPSWGVHRAQSGEARHPLSRHLPALFRGRHGSLHLTCPLTAASLARNASIT